MWARPIGMSRSAPDARASPRMIRMARSTPGPEVTLDGGGLLVGQVEVRGDVHRSEDTRASAAVGTVHDTVRFAAGAGPGR